MGKIFNILIVGVGGQGTILASDIVSQAALNNGYDVKKSEIHGMSQRGGSVFSHVRFGEKVYSPVIPKGEVDVVVSLENMEIIRWFDFLSRETKVILLKNKILPANVTEYPEGIDSVINGNFSDITAIEPENIAEKLGNKKFLNVYILGVLSKSVSINEDSWKKAIELLVPEGTFDANWNAFISGRDS